MGLDRRRRAPTGLAVLPYASRGVAAAVLIAVIALVAGADVGVPILFFGGYPWQWVPIHLGLCSDAARSEEAFERCLFWSSVVGLLLNGLTIGLLVGVVRRWQRRRRAA